MIRTPRSIVRRALITEKGTVLRETAQPVPLRSRARRQQDRDQARGRDHLHGEGGATSARMQMRGKVKRQGRYAGRRSDWKKAIVTLKPDQKIELFEQI